MTVVSEAQILKTDKRDKTPLADFQANVERWTHLSKARKEIAQEMDDITAWFSSLITGKMEWVEGSNYVTVTVVRPQTPQLDVDLLAEIAPGLADIVTETKTVIDRDALKQMIELGLFDATQNASRALSYKASAPSVRVSVVEIDEVAEGNDE